jgi:hypothetical protein
MAAQPALDDSLDKLQDFCRLLGETTVVLEQDTEILGARSGGFQERETDARERTDGVGERLEAAREEIDRVRADAVEELDAVAEAAERMSAASAAADDRCGAGEGSFEQSLERSQAELEKEFEELAEGGFTRLDAAVDETDAELARDDGAAEDAAEALEAAWSTLAQQAAQAGSDLGAVLHEAAEDLEKTQAGALAEDGAEHARLWSEELPQVVQAECQSVADPLEALYRDWEADIDGEADALGEAVVEILQDAGNVLVQETGEPVSAAAEELAGGALQSLTDEQEGLEPILEECESAGAAVAELVDDLAIGHRIVGEIDRVLETLKE